jgi:hypothetical protein
MGVPQHLELSWHPRADRLMIINRPGCAHGNDHVEGAGLRKLNLDVWRWKTVFWHDLVQNKIKSALRQPFTHKARSADVIMLDQQRAHGQSLIRIRTISRWTSSCDLSQTELRRYRSYPNKCC